MKISIKYETDYISDFIDISEFNIQCSGVYLIYDKNKKLVYVGKAKNLSARIKNHYYKTNNIYNELYGFEKNEMSKHYKYVRYFKIDEEYNRSSVEQKLIVKLKPEFNKQYSNDKKTERYNNIVSSAYHKYMINKIGEDYENKISSIYHNL